MKYFIFLIILIGNFSFIATAQPDSLLVKKDTTRKDTASLFVNPERANDSVSLVSDTTFLTDSLLMITAADTVNNKTITKAIIKDETKTGDSKEFSGKEALFYYLIFLFLLFGLLRLAFAKYFNDLFRVFFRTTLKQKQMMEQLLQSPLPSVLMNVFFVLSAGLYVNFLLINFNLLLSANFWLQYLYCMLAIGLIYITKFLGLKIAGWLFNVYEATESYIFVVFIINKMLGILLLPFILLFAFSGGLIIETSIYISWVFIFLLLGYRVILSAGIARNEIKLRAFHFVLYILGFEIVPVLLIYKLLLLIF